MFVYFAFANIHSQLLDHSDKMAACLGFHEPTISANEVWNPIRDMLGWKNQTEFDSPCTGGLQTSENNDRKGPSRSGATRFQNIHGIRDVCAHDIEFCFDSIFSAFRMSFA